MLSQKCKKLNSPLDILACFLINVAVLPKGRLYYPPRTQPKEREYIMQIRNRKGFTLVEIMIVVLIIGLLAAMAIPAFMKVRKESIAKTMRNDARLISNAAQQYFMKYGLSEAPLTYIYDSDVTNTMASMNKISQGMTFTTDPLPANGQFEITHALIKTGTAVQFYVDSGDPVVPADLD